MKFIIVGLSFLTAFLVMFGLLKRIFSKESSVERLSEYMESDNPYYDEEETERKGGYAVVKAIGQQMAKFKFITYFTKSTTTTLIQADIALTGEELTVIQIVLAIPFSYAVLVFKNDILLSIVTFIGVWAMPLFYIKHQRNARLKKFDEQLSDALVIFSNSLKAGYSYLQAVGSIAKEMPDPISKEFARVLKEMSFGVDQSQSLNNLLERVESDDLQLMVTAVNIQRDTGGNLAEILDSISKTIRERVQLKGEVKTLTAQGRFSGIVVSLIPFALGFFMYLINREYIMMLFTEPIGRILVVVAMVNELIGIMFIKKIVDIEM